jgi:hypothetical protein
VATGATPAAIKTANQATIRQAATSSLAGPVRLVRILALCQALFFVALFLFLCAHAGAETASQLNFTPELKLSSFTPQKQRDPFGGGLGKVGEGSSPATTAAASAALKLQGILYQAGSPSAMVNNRLIQLNKPTTVSTDQGEMEIKAVEITRNTVVLEAGGQKVELRLNRGGQE